MESVIKWAVIFAGIGVGTLLLFTGMNSLFGIAGERLTHRLRQLSFKVQINKCLDPYLQAILRKNIGFFDFESHSTGVLTSRLASDASLVEGLVGSQLANLVMNLCTAIAGELFQVEKI